MLFDLAVSRLGPVRRRLILAVVLSGIANTAVMYFISEAVYATPEPGVHLLFGFLAACAAYAVYLRYGTRMIAETLELIVRELRTRIAEKLSRVELAGLEHLSIGEICDQVTREGTLIAANAWTLALALQSSIMLVMSSLYVGSLSPLSFVLVLFLYGGGGYLYYQRRRAVRQAMERLGKDQKSLLRVLEDVFKGAKELRTSTRRRNAILNELRAAAVTLQEGPAHVNWLSQQRMLIGKAYLFLLMASLVFVVPLFSPSSASAIGAILSAVILMFNPLRDVQVALPEYERADHALMQLIKLERHLERLTTQTQPVATSPFGSTLHELRVDNLRYEHCDETGQPSFAVGPVSFEVKAGEIVFLVGGNGSGKTTLFKVLTTLFKATSGEMRVNGVKVEEENRQAYREMLGAIFTDFHLFKKLYGQEGVEEERVNEWIEKLGLRGRTKYEKGEFSKLTLSTGQRKRLALAVALIEDRPMYFFDEWAADQDPEFRKYYYEELLPELKRKGKTVVAITHDDRYFGCADRVITLEYGSIKSIVTPAASAAPAGKV